MGTGAKVLFWMCSDTHPPIWDPHGHFTVGGERRALSLPSRLQALAYLEVLVCQGVIPKKEKKKFEGLVRRSSLPETHWTDAAVLIAMDIVDQDKIPNQ